MPGPRAQSWCGAPGQGAARSPGPNTGRPGKKGVAQYPQRPVLMREKAPGPRDQPQRAMVKGDSNSPPETNPGSQEWEGVVPGPQILAYKA